ncbi:glycosyltransferase family 2 protein [Candidatus Magnetominusculus xianensis]|uniref:Glycosyl transferase family 2 n=1 Tax=Candidatus Magnetominusculus xianensis TaxID=1748249 RepID=A0ABR5SEI4_9BACT|nr:glycosyltransferase family 2 protein [Candidatus Magnetominusculus xianensis]KWT82984.1 glycosyl transferase family 2 [Candidatus Magnetominusculus xianensis]MBF0403063.1 glycosyltransferase family 2 protein [Nitrospirota bacterium]
MQYKASIIIPTYNRPVDLKNCIRSILDQTVLPYELIVIDDGNLSELPLKAECEQAGIKYVYFKKDKPGLTASRNKGIELVTGDIVFFFDDDVVLFPDYIEQILNIYNMSEDVGGVGGAIANHKRLNLVKKIRKILEIPFMVSGVREGRVLPSGFCTSFGTTPFEIKKVTEVDFLSGGVSSFKKEVFNTFKFDAKHFLNYGMGEDKDFSYRVSKAYKLIYTPHARLYHYEAPQMRPNGYREVFMFVVFTHYFFKTHVKKSPVEWLFFFYAFWGYLLSRILVCIFAPKKHNVNKLRGLLGGFYDVIVRGTKTVE